MDGTQPDSEAPVMGVVAPLIADREEPVTAVVAPPVSAYEAEVNNISSLEAPAEPPSDVEKPDPDNFDIEYPIKPDYELQPVPEPPRRASASRCCGCMAVVFFVLFTFSLAGAIVAYHSTAPYSFQADEVSPDQCARYGGSWHRHHHGCHHGHGHHGRHQHHGHGHHSHHHGHGHHNRHHGHGHHNHHHGHSHHGDRAQHQRSAATLGGMPEPNALSSQHTRHQWGRWDQNAVTRYRQHPHRHWGRLNITRSHNLTGTNFWKRYQPRDLPEGEFRHHARHHGRHHPRHHPRFYWRHMNNTEFHNFTRPDFRFRHHGQVREREFRHHGRHHPRHHWRQVNNTEHNFTHTDFWFHEDHLASEFRRHHDGRYQRRHWRQVNNTESWNRFQHHLPAGEFRRHSRHHRHQQHHWDQLNNTEIHKLSKLQKIWKWFQHHNQVPASEIRQHPHLRLRQLNTTEFHKLTRAELRKLWKLYKHHGAPASEFSSNKAASESSHDETPAGEFRYHPHHHRGFGHPNWSHWNQNRMTCSCPPMYHRHHGTCTSAGPKLLIMAVLFLAVSVAAKVAYLANRK